MKIQTHNPVPRKGAIAVCSKGHLGLITGDRLEAIGYADETTGLAWIGIHLKGKMVGKPWSSRNPKVVGHVDDFQYVETVDLK